MRVTRPSALDATEADRVRALAAVIEREDGQPPLSDQALVRMTSAEVRHALAFEDDHLVGYAQLAGDSLDVAGLAAAVGPLLDALGDQRVLVWSHGARSRLRHALADRGFQAVRTLLQLRRPLVEQDPRPAPEDVRVAPFVVGRDEDAWVRVNAAAFARHPEQGRWTRADVEAREAEPWFDPDGFLLAWRRNERGDDLLGFHWTKMHSASLGEVYVIGIDPSAQGEGLGGVLLDAGLAHLHKRGCTDVLLYVEADNAVALKLYERSGFAEYDRDIQWRSG